MVYVLLIAGFVLLIKGADLFVDGSSSIAKKLRIPGIIVGLTIVAMGTSAPEAAVSISATFKGSNEIAVGNVVGSNILNLLLVVGVSALIRPMKVDKSILKVDFPVEMISAVVLLLLCMGSSLVINRIEGIILFAMFVTYMIITIRRALKYRQNTVENPDEETMSWLKSVLFVVIGAAAVIAGGQLTVNSAKTIAESWGVSETLIGLTVVALGTSLPELVTSVIAAKKGESDMALGNVIGSNIFNIFFILGMTGTIHPIKVDMVSIYDIAVLIVISVISFIFAATRKKIARAEGVSMLVMYSAYTAYIIAR